MFKKFLKDESGVTAIEYGVIAAAMGVALVVIMPKLASQVDRAVLVYRFAHRLGQSNRVSAPASTPACRYK